MYIYFFFLGGGGLASIYGFWGEISKKCLNLKALTLYTCKYKILVIGY